MAKKEILNKEMFRERALVIKWYLYDFFVELKKHESFDKIRDNFIFDKRFNCYKINYNK